MASCRHNPLTSAAVTTAMLLVLALTASCPSDWSFADADGTVSVGGDSLTLTLVRDTLIEGHDVAVCDSSQMHSSRHGGEALLTGEATPERVAPGLALRILDTITIAWDAIPLSWSGDGLPMKAFYSALTVGVSIPLGASHTVGEGV